MLDLFFCVYNKIIYISYTYILYLVLKPLQDGIASFTKAVDSLTNYIEKVKKDEEKLNKWVVTFFVNLTCSQLLLSPERPGSWEL